jgi:hypothetical protein
MAGFTYRLYLANGEDVGTFTTAVPDWRVGDEFISRDHVHCRILDMLDGDTLGDESEFAGVWTVTPLQLPEPGLAG